MNARVPRSTLQNPFLQPSTPTLADVLQLLNGIDLEPTRKRNLLSAVRRVCELLQLAPDHVPAVAGELRTRMADAHAARFGIAPKTWANIRSNLLTALSLSKVSDVLRTAKIPRTAAWHEIYEQLDDRRTREGLSRFTRFCSLNEIDPCEVNTTVLQAFGKAVRESSFARKADVLERDVATLWNRLVDQHPEGRLQRLELASRRPPPTRVNWANLPESFRRDVEEHLAWASGADPFAVDARAKPLSPSSVRLRQQYIQTAITSLVESGTPVETITSLSNLTTPEAYKLILRHRHTQASGEANAFNDGLAKALVAIAKEWVRPDALTLAELKRLRSRLPGIRLGLTEKNKALLRTLDDRQLQLRLFDLPEQLWLKALKRPSSLKRLADAQAALAIGILIYAPLRVANLTSLEFGRTLFLPRRDGEETLIEIPAAEMKTREPFSIALPPVFTPMLRAYKDEVLQPLLSHKAVHLFDNGKGVPKGKTTISWLIERTLERHLGIAMTAHQFRHFTAKLLLDAHPGGHEMVRQLLGHANLKTTVGSYAGLDTRRAGRVHAELVESVRRKAEERKHVRPGRMRS